MKREKGREGQQEWEGIRAWGERNKGHLAWGEYSENKNFKEAFLYFNQGQDLSPSGSFPPPQGDERGQEDPNWRKNLIK